MAKRTNIVSGVIKVDGNIGKGAEALMNTITNTKEMVDMNNVEREVVLCGECGVELERVELTFDGADLCVKCAQDIVAELELAQEVETDDENAMFANQYIKIKEVQARIDNGIRNAIKSGTKQLKDKPKYVSAKELQGLVKYYKYATGFDMSDAQKEYMKKLNGTQAYYISMTLKKASSSMVRNGGLIHQAKANA